MLMLVSTLFTRAITVRQEMEKSAVNALLENKTRLKFIGESQCDFVLSVV